MLAPAFIKNGVKWGARRAIQNHLLPKRLERYLSRRMTPSARLDVRTFVDAVNRAGGTYHRLDWGNGLVLNGIYDIRKHLHHYGIPDDLRSKTALDVGTASGFFAFECARRGAEVTAVDLMDDRWIWFKQGRAAGLDVRYLTMDIYDLNPTFGQFDMVICGSLLLHLRDLLGAIKRLRSVCKGQAIIATAALSESVPDDRPYCEFKALKGEGGDGEYWHYWEVSSAALRQMCLAAGFSQAREEGRFILESEPTSAERHAVPHVVVKATV
jgi:2-polyprenyl-3-methyl-5-hydroxy-6-metoxy-1,4-benzoquinol methylase